MRFTDIQDALTLRRRYNFEDRAALAPVRDRTRK
jgi:hypothetical protein